MDLKMPNTIDMGGESDVSDKLDLILERLDEIEEKIDNLNLYENPGFREGETL